MGGNAAPLVTERALGADGRIGPLDGLRAVAVLAVILFHASPWAKGGFLGVDVFFVLSGYLITSLLVAEWDRSGTLSLRGFWSRRARRLLPALLCLLATVTAVAAAAPAVLGSEHLVGDTVATLLYAANWHLLAEHADYFATVGHPSPLLHTWTLAIEEQFYVVWPLVLLVVFGRLRRWRRPSHRPVPVRRLSRSPAGVDPGDRRRRLVVLLVLSVGGALASAALMAVLTPIGAVNVDRAYYGSDTHSQGLMVGAALAAAVALWGRDRLLGRAGTRVLWVACLAGLAGVLVLCRFVGQADALTFHGGFLLLAVATAAVVAGTTLLPGHPVSRLLALPPVRYLGRISYGMYLWYWPVLLVLTAGRTGLHGGSLLVARLAVVVALAATSYHLVEVPVRRGAFAGWRSWVAVPAAAAAVAALLPVVAAGSTGELAALPVVRKSAAVVAASGRPVRVLLVGDSMAGSLGVGMGTVAGRFGAEVVDKGMPGCSLAMDQQVRVLWYQDPPGPPCVQGDPGALLRQMRQWVTTYDPDIVVYLARSDTLDLERGGTWQHLGEPGFDHWVASRFAAAVSVLGSGGARVVLLTTPLYDSGEQGDGSPWPENDPHRVAVDNRLLTQAARADPGTATVIDLGRLLSPGNRFAATVDGVPVRCSDGVHITVAGGAWIGTRLLPRLAALGQAHSQAAWTAGRAPIPPQAPPSWYTKLPCAT